MAKAKPREPVKIERRTVRVKPHSYQPSKAELEEPVKIDATPEELAAAVLRPVRIVEDSDA
ncbi:MAG: hypothetical protein OYH76_17995 [Defluviicoccus sp.]|nr:hypothetical protein [Defluviicoccus sp.]MDE0277790.1 hypothetical protein [Defluviicoccus sp.]